MKIKGMYVELDALFDTRLSIINLLNKNLSLELLGNENYTLRYFDEFDYISNNVFNNYYKNRNKTVLQNSYITKLIELVVFELDVILSKKIDINDNTPVKLDVNVYPYELTDDEKEKIKEALLIYNIVPEVEIQIINISTEDLTLNQIGSNYSMAMMYDVTSWLEYQLAVSLNSSAIDTVIYGSALLKEALVFKDTKALENLFKMQEELYKPYIHYTAISTLYYCTREIMNEKIKENYSK